MVLRGKLIADLAHGFPQIQIAPPTTCSHSNSSEKSLILRAAARASPFVMAGAVVLKLHISPTWKELSASS